MSRKALLVNYEFCTGCHTCEVACKQEHDYSAGNCGIRLNEVLTEGKRVRVDYLPYLTEFCDLCAGRTTRGELPACVKHCQSQCMQWGDLEELAKSAEDKPRSLILAPRASYHLPLTI